MCAVGDWYAGLHEPHLPKSHPGSIWGDHEKGLLSLAAVGGGGGGGWVVEEEEEDGKWLTNHFHRNMLVLCMTIQETLQWRFFHIWKWGSGWSEIMVPDVCQAFTMPFRTAVQWSACLSVPGVSSAPSTLNWSAYSWFTSYRVRWLTLASVRHCSVMWAWLNEHGYITTVIWALSD